MANSTELSIPTTSWGSGEYALFFYGIIRGLRPFICVELGTFAGYSAYFIASGLLCNGKGHLDCYDLWEDYPYTHVEMKIAERNLANLPVTLRKEDAKDVYKHYKDNSVDFLMIDLSNDGVTYENYLRDWYPKLTQNAIVLMEGGAPERDHIEWMVKYDKKPIIKSLKTDSFILSHYNFAITESFPGVVMFTKKDFS